ncbi:MAG: NAD-binding protein [Oscillospiraceae bacterium]
MKIVIVGAGRVGYAIAEQLLTEGHDITVVESDPERAAYISSTLDVIVVAGPRECGSATHCQRCGRRPAHRRDDLRTRRTSSAAWSGASSALRIRSARVRDEEYYQDVALLQDELGLSLSINPERTSAKEISRTLRFPAATKVEPFANGLVELVEFKLREGQQARRPAPERFPRPLQRRHPHLRRGARGQRYDPERRLCARRRRLCHRGRRAARAA